MELGPLEIKIHSLQKSIDTEVQEISELQQRWLRDQSELDPPLRGDLRLADSETGSMREINITDSLLKKYRAAVEELATRVETFCNRREIGYVLAQTEIPFDQLVLLILRRGGLVA